jgi:predicted nucleic acid-binding protein
VILVDSSIWIDHFRSPLSGLELLLRHRRVLGHPAVRGEVAMGSLKDRLSKLAALDQLPMAEQASDAEVFRAIEDNRWFSRGIGFIDAHLLASAMTTPDTRLWTVDSQLAEIADEHRVLFES